jgi:hypothetical protein
MMTLLVCELNVGEWQLMNTVINLNQTLVPGSFLGNYVFLTISHTCDK